MRRRLPAVAKTAARDVLQWRRSRRFAIDPQGPWWGHDIAFVWQRHDLFHASGLELPGTSVSPPCCSCPRPRCGRRSSGAPRPGWGRLLERRRAPGVARRRPGPPVGASRWSTRPSAWGCRRNGCCSPRPAWTWTCSTSRPTLRRSGSASTSRDASWSGGSAASGGSTVEQAVEAASTVPGAALLSSATVPNARIERLARDLGVGPSSRRAMPHDELPALLAAMDVAVVLAQRGEPFHYSPLKVAEYLARRPARGGPPASASWPNGSATGSTRCSCHLTTRTPSAPPWRLRDDPEDRARLGKAALAAEAEWSWDHQVQRGSTRWRMRPVERDGWRQLRSALAGRPEGPWGGSIDEHCTVVHDNRVRARRDVRVALRAEGPAEAGGGGDPQAGSAPCSTSCT